MRLAQVQVKVIDFGSSCFIHDELHTYVQSRSYRAPEVILGVLPYRCMRLERSDLQMAIERHRSADGHRSERHRSADGHLQMAICRSFQISHCTLISGLRLCLRCDPG